MRAATLFSGIGAPEQARPDWRWLWSAEVDPFASAVLAARHPHSTNLGDVTADDFAERALAVGRPDVLVFGSPCQSFSVAGKRLGLGDARGNLALVALAVVRAVRPDWFVFENVPGLLSSEGGQDFATFLEAVADIGYFGAWRVLDAQHFGLAQRRERLFFVGCLGDWRGPAAVLFERESLQGHPAPRRETGEGAARSLAASPVGGNGYRNDDDTADSLIANCLDAHGSADRMDGESETFVSVTHSLTTRCAAVEEDGTGRGSPLVPVTFDWQAGGGGTDESFRGKSRSYITDKPGRTRALTANKSLAVAFTCKDHGADAGDLAPTLRAMGHDGSWANGGGQVAVQQAAAVRRLTPRECERLQGFPDDYTAVSHRGKPAADRPRYRALGNSMAVPVLRWLLARIEAAWPARLDEVA